MIAKSSALTGAATAASVPIARTLRHRGETRNASPGLRNYRPNAPPEARGVVVVTGALMGDPHPSRSALGVKMRAHEGQT